MSTSALSTLSQQQISSLEQSRQTQLQQPIQNWKSQIQTDQTQLSAWGKISGALSSLNTAVSSIKNPSSFNDRGATSSAKNVATATVTKSASPGQYDLTNVKQAQTQELYSSTYASGSASIGSGSGSLTFSFAGGSSETVSVSAGNNTLNGIAQAINQKTGGQVSASIVGGSTGQRLVLTGNATGSQQSFTISGTGALSGLSYGSSTSTMTQARAARNATLNVNGVPVTSQSNTLTGAIPNGTVTVAGSGSTSIGVSVDPSKLSSGVASVIKKLNSAVSAISKATAFQKGSGSSSSKAGPLLGDYSATSLSSKLVNAVSGLSNGTLSGRDIGITTNKDGTISFDSTQFASAFQSNPSAVNDLVSQLHDQMSSITQGAIGATGQGGFIAAQQKSINQSISNLNSEISQQNQFVNQEMQIYTQQFGTMQSKQNSLQVQNSYLSLLNGSGSSNGG
ncbi:flagellar filament capping protein FliD [Salinisphaera sp. RV14]|uniref:flagellar filament capping protein FliD n=1 Tax=unclassified Salinisphaera TaxID=2649847 RepID=UPI003F847DEF